MASVLKYLVDSSQIQRDIQYRHDRAITMERINFINARKIQAWFRGIITRRHFYYLHKVTIVIQKCWRGYSARLLLKKLRVQKEIEQLEKLRNQSAIKIQAAWNGYKSRKNIYDYYKMKQWLQNEKEKEEAVKREKENKIIKQLDEESKPWVLFILKKLHHLRRTRCHPGVITKIDETHSTTIERLISCLGHKMDPFENL